MIEQGHRIPIRLYDYTAQHRTEGMSASAEAPLPRLSIHTERFEREEHDLYYMAAFLILSIVFNTFFASCYKVAARKNCNLQMVNVWVYVGSTGTMLAYILAKGHLPLNPHALLLGTAAGILVFFATLTFFHHMKRGQLSASWTVISLSIGFPVLASIFIWHEHPSPRQIVGMALIVIALILFGRHETNQGGKAL